MSAIAPKKSRLIPLLAAALAATGNPATASDDEFFEESVRPVLVEHCSACHGAQVQMAELDLTTPAGFYRGGQSGPVFVAHDPESSRMMAAVRYEGTVKMPPTGKLPDAQIDALARWIEGGAPWPGHRSESPAPAHAAESRWTEEQRKHWAFQPVRMQAPPAVVNEEWVRTPVDRFILARLEREGLAPAGRTDDLTLLRRATYDLHGLPPSPAQIRQFLADTEPDRFERLLDRLLSSPRYGEKWGRHWLDVARYADSTGLDDDIKLPHTWKYRDYVIEAFNRDMPFDEFVVEQLAGDTLRPNSADGLYERGIIATGFLAVGTKPLVQQDKIKMKYDVVDEQLDTTAKVFMGLTMGCARCHDHKFDPISARDYYSMAAIFASAKNFESLDPSMTVSKVHFEPLVSREVYQRFKDHGAEIGNVKLRIKSIRNLAMHRYVLSRSGPKLAAYLLAAREVYEDGADVEEVAAREGLDCETVSLWAEYLEPGSELLLHLEQWHDADEANRAAVALEYQRRFVAKGREWIGDLAAWRERIEEWDGSGEFPEAPELPPGADRFFSEVTLPAELMDEGAAASDGPFAVPTKAVDWILPSASLQRVEELRAELQRLEETAPPKPPMAYAPGPGEMVEQRVFVRGNHGAPGEPVPRQFPAILAGKHQEPITEGSGRPELARWLVSQDHPLTARVLANRLWQWHFGHGLVRTPNNFGLMGERPTHPQLLDYLGARLVAGGWSLKAMHRLLMSSSAYQMQSEVSEQAWAGDPANRLVSRFGQRRLVVEEMRDSLLALDGSLDLAMGGVLTESLDSYGFKNAYLHPDDTRRRTVYLPVYRNKLPNLFTLFDFADPSTSTAVRASTSVAPQGLYFMNSEFVHERAGALAERVLEQDGPPDADRVEQAYQLALARSPDAVEVNGALEYMARYPVARDASDPRLERWRSFCRLLLGSNEYSYVN